MRTFEDAFPYDAKTHLYILLWSFRNDRRHLVTVYHDNYDIMVTTLSLANGHWQTNNLLNILTEYLKSLKLTEFTLTILFWIA